MIYVINSVMIFLYAIICRYVVYPERKKVFLFICMFQMTLIMGFRYRVGADYLTYERIYEELANGYISYSGARIEFGYRILNVMLGRLGVPFWGLNFLMALFTNLFLAKSIYKMVEKYEYVVMTVYLYVAFFFFYHSMNMSRQGLAICMGIYAISCYLSGEKRKGIIWILIASTMHVSALLYLSVVVIKEIEINRRTIILYIVGTIAIEYGINIFQYLLRFTKYSLYFDDFYNKSLLSSTIINFIVRVIMLIMAFMTYNKINKSELKNCLYNMVIICTLIQGLAVRASIYGRVTTCFFIAYIFLVPMVVENIKRFSIRITYSAVIIMGTFYQYIYYMTNWKNVLANSYTSIFNSF